MAKIKETCGDHETLLREISGLAWAGIYSSREDACDAAEAACSAIVDRIMAWQEAERSAKGKASGL
ncbi:hypothetical protein [Beijerinckia indica]|uniref:Uncharacterized protein n=1 Tax=Beijerinckia indica subsp. indica (strain ATCC 9039 / DSM 1715 / NCIMB 8712) TaxID=395963 RepID=B2ICE8_BEII9|nr:hypothetical protein [Beijerinckia indica]ACB96748.1 hypothetical protein Bind_3188 [Beijerinckia indica subsp. indica ATCC 9039]